MKVYANAKGTKICILLIIVRTQGEKRNQIQVIN